MVRQFVYFVCANGKNFVPCRLFAVAASKSNYSELTYMGFTYFVVDAEVRAAVQALLVDEGRNTEGSACSNCGTPSSMEICFECLQRQQCKKCRLYLPDHLFVTHTLCRACNKKQNKPRPTLQNALNETATEIPLLREMWMVISHAFPHISTYCHRSPTRRSHSI